jgi:Zn-dependent protease/predicted transcriptional regulator
MEQSIRLGRVSGVEVGLNWSLLVVFWLLAWSLAAGRFPAQIPGYATVTYWVAGVTTAIIFFACLLAHEMGHAIMARRAGVKVEGITLWLFGGIARLRGEAMNPAAELRITAVGPAISLILAGAFALVAWALESMEASDLLVGVAGWLGFINAVLAGFNLVPAFPLDGGRVLRAILWRRKGDRLGATRTAARAGRIFAYGLIGLGIVEFAYAATFGGLWFVFLGWFLLGAAQSEESQTLLRGALRDVQVEDIMSPDPVAIPESSSVETVIDQYALSHRFTTFPLKDDAGSVAGLVTLSRVKAVPREERPRTPVREIACPMDEVATVRPNDPAVVVLERMQACSDGRALVMENDQLVGIVSPRDVQRALDRAGLRGEQAPRISSPT